VNPVLALRRLIDRRSKLRLSIRLCTVCLTYRRKPRTVDARASSTQSKGET
jgi:hypothetical protein